ncbi:MAG: response regulator [Candidatus Pacebacteria bacterium]|nr:response regulator [Candidatus Paceibacterota bacterium]
MEKSENEKILLVDDEEYLLKSLEVFLKNETNHEIFTASDGKDAIEIFDSEDVDLILTDLKMPEISGLELIEYVKGKSKDVPVIAMTAYASLNSALEVLRVGAYDYLMKPYEFDMVLMVVERAIERARLTAESEEKNKLNAIAVAAVTLSHETNNLLTGIMGYLEIFLDDLPEDKKEIKKGLSIMLDNSRKIAAVVKKFQEVRKYVITKYRAEETMLDLEKAISDVNK